MNTIFYCSQKKLTNRHKAVVNIVGHKVNKYDGNVFKTQQNLNEPLNMIFSRLAVCTHSSVVNSLSTKLQKPNKFTFKRNEQNGINFYV